MTITLQTIFVGFLVLGHLFPEWPDEQVIRAASPAELVQHLHQACTQTLTRPELAEFQLLDIIDWASQGFSQQAGQQAGRFLGAVNFAEALEVMLNICSRQTNHDIFSDIDLASVFAEYDRLRDQLPDPSKLRNSRPPQLTQIFDRDNQLIAENFEPEQRYLWWPIKDIPLHVQQAFVAVEDRSFYENVGVDLRGMIRAFIKIVMQDGRPEGGSTITQQLIKNRLLTPAITIERKLQEMMLARQVTELYSKDEIMELYLNSIFLGRRSWGIATASQAYFGKWPNELSVKEGAFLAAITQGPSIYEPEANMTRVNRRLDHALSRMQAEGYISESDLLTLKTQELRFRPRPIFRPRAPYFMDEVRRQLEHDLGSEVFSRGALNVQTTLNPKLQAISEQSLRQGLIQYERQTGQYAWRGPVTNISEEIATQAQLMEEESKSTQASMAEQEGEASTATTSRPIRPNNNLFTALTRQHESQTDDHKEDASSSAESSAPLDSETGESSSSELYIEDMGFEVVDSSLPPLPAPKPYNIGYAQSPPWLKALRRISHPLVQEMNWELAVVLDNNRLPLIGLTSGQTQELKASYFTRRPSLSYGDVIFLDGEELIQPPEIQGAVVAMDPNTGAILSMVGGFSYSESQFNRSTFASRQPGSTFKPFVFLAALQAGMRPNDTLVEQPISFPPIARGGHWWTPSNYDNSFAGRRTLRWGLEHSRNVMTALLLRHMDLHNVQSLSEELGIYNPAISHYPFVLGAQETQLLNLTTAYASLANGGYKVSPQFVRGVFDHNGLSHYAARFTASPLRGVDKVSIYQVRSILQGVLERGTARRIRDLAPYVAGKTGTTNRFADAWFIGFTPHLVVGVYVGYDNEQRFRSLGHGQTGANVALPIFESIIRESFQVYHPPEPFPTSVDGAHFYYVHRNTGESVSANHPDAVYEALRWGQNPPAPSVAQYPSYSPASPQSSSQQRSSGYGTYDPNRPRQEHSEYRTYEPSPSQQAPATNQGYYNPYANLPSTYQTPPRQQPSHSGSYSTRSYQQRPTSPPNNQRSTSNNPVSSWTDIELQGIY